MSNDRRQNGQRAVIYAKMLLHQIPMSFSGVLSFSSQEPVYHDDRYSPTVSSPPGSAIFGLVPRSVLVFKGCYYRFLSTPLLLSLL